MQPTNNNLELGALRAVQALSFSLSSTLNCYAERIARDGCKDFLTAEELLKFVTNTFKELHSFVQTGDKELSGMRVKLYEWYTKGAMINA